MSLLPVTYKTILDNEGYFKALELWQGGKFITISLQSEGTHYAGYRWKEIREAVDRIQLNESERVQKSNSFASTWQKSLEEDK